MNAAGILSDEVWKPIPWLPGYEVSSDGRARSVSRYVVGNPINKRRFSPGKVLKLSTRPNGYVFFGTHRKSNHLSRIVLRVFVGEPLAGQQARHLDGNKTNNSIRNLAWGTAKENAQDKRRHGTYGEGERHSMAKLSDEQVVRIRADCRPTKVIAQAFNVSVSHVGSLKRGTFRASAGGQP